MALRHVDLLALNEDEAAAFAGRALDAADPKPLLAAALAAVRAEQPAVRVLVTLGPHGAWAWDGCAWRHQPAPSVPVRSTAGAGDAFLGGVLTALALDLPLVPDGLELGALLAAYKITSPHTIPPEVDRPLLRSFAAVRGIGLSPALARFLSET